MGYSRKIMEGPELELFYEMFHTYDPPADPSKKFIFKPDYNIWSDYISTVSYTHLTLPTIYSV